MDKTLLVSAVRDGRGSIPIICVNSYQFEEHPEGCVGVENAPLAILDAIASATQMGLAQMASRKQDLVFSSRPIQEEESHDRRWRILALGSRKQAGYRHNCHTSPRVSAVLFGARGL